MDVLDRFKAWIRRQPRAETGTSDVNYNIFWLSGIAGTGKTTIAYTIAQWTSKRGLLGASFFCSRLDADRSDALKLIFTIAFQLGIFYPPYGQLLSDIVRADPLIINAAIPTQLATFIVEPLRKLSVGSEFPECIVLVDAADECGDKDTTSTIISCLLLHSQSLHRIRFLITSRPEEHISVPFDRADLRNASGRLSLDQVELTTVTHDIKQYLRDVLSSLGDEDIDALVDLSKGWFIFAATAVRFITDRKYKNPRGQLRRLLSLPRASHRLLDDLYLNVLDAAVSEASEELAGTMRLLLATIVLAQEPLSPTTLAHLLGLDPHYVIDCLGGLRAVLVVPSLDELDKVIHTIHLTFPEFLTDPERCTNPHFLVSVSAHHTLLLSHCLRTMSSHLKYNICDIQNPSLLNSEVPELASAIDSCIPGHLRYSCRHWASHLAGSDLSQNGVVTDLRNFALTHMLHWLEVCSLLGTLRDALTSTNSAERVLTVCDDIIFL